MSSQTFKAFWKDVAVKTLVTLSASAIIIILKFCWDWYNHDVILATFNDGKALLTSSFLSIVNFEIKIWVLVTCIACFFLFKFLFRKYMLSRENNETVDETKILSYTADKFYNFTWEWKWIYNTKIGIYEVKKLHPCCPDPDCNHTPMEFVEESLGYSVYKCYKCYRNKTITTNLFGNTEDAVISQINYNAKLK